MSTHPQRSCSLLGAAFVSATLLGAASARALPSDAPSSPIAAEGSETAAEPPSEPSAPLGTAAPETGESNAPPPAASEQQRAPTPRTQGTPVATPPPPGTIDLRTPPSDCEPCTRRPHEQAEGSGGFLLGMALIDLSSLNDRLEQAGYTRLSGPFTLMGGEGHGVMDSGFVVGVRGAAIFGPNGDGPGGLSSSVGGGFGMLDLGFALVRTRPALLTLMAGIGGYGMSLDIQDDQSARFDDVLSDPRRGTSLGRGGLLVGLTLGFDGRVPVGEAEEGQQGFFTLGGRVGALYGPALGDWDLPGGGNASSGPSFGLTGGFAALVIGFGGRPTEAAQ